ncbi:hypothetical protein [Xanthomonas oryzae]|uniref:hypothetical protein n=1 Tax=Xanthomonas oryzae TaxID=347 RepID=UPI000A55A007|nr:hypothetical protein [Xanthomonas oryzae]
MLSMLDGPLHQEPSIRTALTTLNYQGREYSRTIEITQAQYDAMKNFGDNPAADGFSTYYNGLNNSCIDFTWKALEKGGLNPSGFQGDLWPTNNIESPLKNPLKHQMPCLLAT